MRDKDTKLIFEAYKGYTDAETRDLKKDLQQNKNNPHFRVPVDHKLKQLKKQTGKEKVSEQNDREQFHMSEEDFVKAEEELNGLRLSRFVQEHDVDADQPVAIHATLVQKHYGKIHSHQYSPVTGNSIADAMRGFGAGKLRNLLRDEQERGKSYIITKVETGSKAQEEFDKKDNMNRSVGKWYGDLDRGRTNYRGD